MLLINHAGYATAHAANATRRFWGKKKFLGES